MSPFLDECLFLIDSFDPWYRDVLIYLQTQWFNPQLSQDECQCIHHQAKIYLIIGDTLISSWCRLSIALMS
jgi:hypothetical protein